MSNKRLLYIAGPTAVGKTALSVALAKYFRTEIISCDARQCYKEMSIGTAVPSFKEMEGIPHHFIHNKRIHHAFGAGDFEKEGLELLKKLFQKYDTLIMVGGSGLYAKALMEGLDIFPKITKTARDIVWEIYQSSGLQGLQKALVTKDPAYYKTVDLLNPRRLIRALEVCETAQKPYSYFLGQSVIERFFKTQTLLLTRHRKQLYERINERAEEMVKGGLEKEAQSLYSYKELSALKTVGYSEWFDHFDSKLTREETIIEIQKNTRRYAKRQMTWFQKIDTTPISMEELKPTLEQAIHKIGKSF